MARLRFLIPAAVLAVAGLSIVAFLVSAALGAIVLVGLVLVALLLSRRLILEPVESLGRAVKSHAEGNYAARADAHHGGELGELEHVFNVMANRIQLEMEQASQERGRLAAALNSSVDGVIALSADGSVAFANSSAEVQFGVAAGQALAGQQLAWFLPDEAMVDAFRASRDKGLASQGVVERPGRRFYQVVTTAIQGGGEWAVLLVVRDISEVTRTEQVRRDFVANVSHELRTPLAGMKSVMETLLDGALDEREVALDFLGKAVSEIDRLVHVVEELLELSRIESGEFPLTLTETDLKQLISVVVERLQPQAGRKALNITLRVDEDSAPLFIDATKIDRALANLIENAIKFSPEQGTVVIEGRRSEAEVVVSVSDSGPGIDEAELPRIFERFYKADRSRLTDGGSGLGLAIAKHAVEAHGGTLAVESRLGQGSVLTLTVPLPTSETN